MKNLSYLTSLLLFLFITSCSNSNSKPSAEQSDGDYAAVAAPSSVTVKCSAGTNIKRVKLALNDDFHHLASVGRVDVVFTQGEQCSLEIEGDSTLLSDVMAEVDSKMLTLRLRPDDHLNRYGRSPHVTAYVSAPSLQYISLCETGSFTSLEEWASDVDVSLGAMGKGSFSIEKLTCPNFLYQSSGSDRSEVRYLKAESARFNASHECVSSFNVDVRNLGVELSGKSSLSLKGRAVRSHINCDSSAKLNNEVVVE